MIKTSNKVLTYFAGKAITAVISLAIIPLFIGWFGEEKYGEYILIYTTFLIFISGSIGWINQSIIRFHGDFTEDRNLFYLKARNLSFKISLITSAPLLILIYASTNNISILLMIIIFMAFILGCMYVTKLVEIQSELKSSKYTISEVLRLVSFFVFCLAFKYLNLFDVLELIFFSLFLSYLISYFFLTRKIQFGEFNPWSKFDKVLLRKFLAFGLPLSIWMVFSPSANGVDRYILNSYLGVSVLARYAAVYDIIFKIFTQLANPINSVFQPLLMNISSTGNKDLFNKTMKKAIMYLFFISIPVFIIIYYLRDFIIVNFLGFKDIETIDQLKKLILPLAVSAFIWQVAIIYQKRLEAQNKTGFMAIAMSTVIIIFSIVTILIIPYYGIHSAAYTSVLSSIFYLTIIIIKNENTKGYSD